MRALDAVSLVGAGLGAYATVRMTLALRATTGKGMLEVLKGLSRQERKKLAEQLVRIENPNISNSTVKTLVRAGQYPKRFAPQAVNQGVRNQLKDALNAAMGITGSAVSGVIRESGGYLSDQMNGSAPEPSQKKQSHGASYVVGIAEAFDTY